MKKFLTTALCVSVMFIGAQAMAATSDSNATYTNKNTTFSTSKQFEKKQPPQFGQYKGKNGERIKGQRPQRPNLDDALNLTDEQKAKAKANRIQGRKEMKPIMEEIHNKKEAILDVMDSDLSKTEQQAKIKELQADIKKLHEKANTIREKNMAEFEKLLTKEQKTKFEQLKKKHNPNGECKQCKRRTPPQMPEGDD